MKSLPAHVEPSNIHPSVSAEVLPEWIRTPVKLGTSSMCGMSCLKRVEASTISLYSQIGMAVLPNTLVPFLTTSSNV